MIGQRGDARQAKRMHTTCFLEGISAGGHVWISAVGKPLVQLKNAIILDIWKLLASPCLGREIRGLVFACCVREGGEWV